MAPQWPRGRRGFDRVARRGPVRRPSGPRARLATTTGSAAPSAICRKADSATSHARRNSASFTIAIDTPAAISLPPPSGRQPPPGAFDRTCLAAIRSNSTACSASTTHRSSRTASRDTQSTPQMTRGSLPLPPPVDVLPPNFVVGGQLGNVRSELSTHRGVIRDHLHR